MMRFAIGDLVTVKDGYPRAGQVGRVLSAEPLINTGGLEGQYQVVFPHNAQLVEDRLGGTVMPPGQVVRFGDDDLDPVEDVAESNPE
jgi:hypothetical protein